MEFPKSPLIMISILPPAFGVIEAAKPIITADVLVVRVGAATVLVERAPEHTSPSFVKIAPDPTTTPARWSIDTRPPAIAIIFSY
jgi:hypothetical protein